MNIIDKKRKLDDEWWDNFLKESSYMKEPKVFKDILTENETSSMRGYISAILKNLENYDGFKAYEDGKTLTSDEIVYIYKNPPKENETVKEWWNRIFGEKNIGLIINQGERNLKLSKKIIELIDPLLKKTGMPTEGFIFTIFVGNYKSTPLGIHLDLPGKNVIHFHLGPGDKTIFTWDNMEEYVSKAGKNSQNNKNYKEHLSYATKNTFSEGDVFCMPEDTYHIGTQDSFSIGVACWLNNRSKRDFASELLSLLTRNYLKGNTDFLIRSPNLNLKPDTNPLGEKKFIEETLALYEFPEEFEKLTFKDVLKEVYNDLRYSLHSNAGLRVNNIKIRDNYNFKLEDFVKIESPFPILYKDSLDGTKLHIFIRGVKFELTNFYCIKQLIDKLNENKPFKVLELVSLFKEDLSDEVGLHILGLLFQNQGIKKLINDDSY